MLVLTRKLNEEIVIGDNIRITIVEVAPGRVKIGVDAPKSVRVDRGEIHLKKQTEGTTPTPAPIAEIVANRIADVLPPVVVEPAAMSASAAPVEHPLPANRLSALRRRFPKKPR